MTVMLTYGDSSATYFGCCCSCLVPVVTLAVMVVVKVSVTMCVTVAVMEAEIVTKATRYSR